MKESELSNKIIQRLNEFETLEYLNPSANWNQSLMNKLTSAKLKATSKISTNKPFIMVLFIVLINIGFILNEVIGDSRQAKYRDKELQVISKELLINPVSINN
jgi:hypothetical protein